MQKKQIEELRKWIEENSVQIEGNLFFEEQDAMTLAMNLALFLDKLE